MAVTLDDIARVVGVRKSTVSVVLNNRPKPIAVSERTRRRIFEAARTLGYHPNAAARALSTKRTGHIGFILSDNVEGGLLNVYYTAHLAGVERACRRLGYGLNISLYNLSNIDSFVFPAKVGQRSVDGLILIGYIQAAVVSRFREFGIPCVGIGDNLEVAALIPTIACDVVGGLLQAVRYAAERGHRRIWYCIDVTRRAREVGELVAARAREEDATRGCRVEVMDSPTGRANYQAAPPLLERWLATGAGERPTVIMASDQVQVMMLRGLAARGLACPRDVSLIASGDSILCGLVQPGLTAVAHDLAGLGEAAAELLIDHLEQGTELTPAMSRSDYPCQLVVRESCGEVL